MKDIIIVYYYGKMVIHPDKFFPITAERFKKLFKVIAMDYEHEKLILSDIKDYLLESAESYKAESKVQA